MDIDRKIGIWVRKIRWRIFLVRLLEGTALALIFGLGASLLVEILSHILPIYRASAWEAVVLVLSLWGFTAYQFIRFPGEGEAALRADSAGLQERVVTAIGLRGDSSAFSEIQRRDTLEGLERVNLKNIIKPRLRLRSLGILLGMVLVFLTLNSISNPQDLRAEEIHSIKTQRAEETKKLEKIAEKIDKSNLREEDKKELLSRLEDVKKDIKKAGSEEELKKAIEKGEKRLELAKKDSENLKELGEKLGSEKALQELAKAVEEGKGEEVKKLAEDLAKNLGSMDKKELKKAAEKLSELTEGIKGNEELKESMKSLSESLKEGAEDGNLSPAAEDMKKLGEELAKALENEEFNKAVEQAMGELQGEEEVARGEGQNPAEGQGQEQGQGQGQGKGQGQGEGQGQGGIQQGQAGQQGGGSGGSLSNDNKVQDYDKIFAPNLLGGDGEKIDLKGGKNQGGKSTYENSKTQEGTKNGTVPYNRVYGDYRDKAMEAIKYENIPDMMKEIIKGYFSALE